MMIKWFGLVLALLCSTTWSKTPIIIDTDMGFDDWVAILYVLKNPNLDVKAITIDCNGLTYCPQGAMNAAKLANLANKKIPIYLGQIDKTNTNFAFPTALREFSSKMTIPGSDSLATYPSEKISAAQAIVELTQKAVTENQPITIMSIGTAVNLADSIHYAKAHQQFSEFQKGVKRIYKAGGAFGETVLGDDKKVQLSNFNIQGNLAIPGFFATNNTMAEWNIYAAVDAMQTVLQAGIPITWVSINASDMAHVTPQALDFLEKYANTDKALRFSIDACRYLVSYQGGWEKIAHNFDFWDTAATVAAFNPDVISEFYHDVPVCLNDEGFNYFIPAKLPGLERGSLVDYHFFPAVFEYYYGVVLVNESIEKEHALSPCNLLRKSVVKTDVIKSINVPLFYKHFAKMS